MSNQPQDNLEKKLADAKSTAQALLNQKKSAVVVSEESVVEVAKKRSTKDIILWIIALTALVLATISSEYLPRYWIAATDVWVQLAVAVGLVIFAFVCLAFTHQGRAFKVLLKDAGTELRRVTWPTKAETTTFTWQVIVLMIIVGIMVWLLDIFFNKVVSFILG